ncbi:MAG TPA: glycosyltransferase [Thermoanaerobaculia bacterium]
MRLAVLGTRGVPPEYGGFETFAAELSTRLVQRGHEVTVYCRERAGGQSAGDVWNGVRRIVRPAIPHKYFETVSHAFVSAVDALGRDFDAVLVCNAANAFVLPLLRAGRIRTAINVDGIERRRRKWNAAGRAVYAMGEAFSVGFADTVVADAEVIARYYREQFSLDPVTIPYGAEFPVEEDSDVLGRLGLEARGYLLYVSRFEPENNPLEVVEAYEKLDAPPPLVMLGSGLYAPELVRELHRHAGPRIRFPGALYGKDYRTLQRNALVYIQATEVGGTHPALIEAMASGGAVLAHATPENVEVGGAAVGYFDLRPEETLSSLMREWISDEPLRERFRMEARRRASELYSWERVVDAYEKLLMGG